MSDDIVLQEYFSTLYDASAPIGGEIEIPNYGFLTGEKITFTQATPEEVLEHKRKLRHRAKSKAARKARKLNR